MNHLRWLRRHFVWDPGSDPTIVKVGTLFNISLVYVKFCKVFVKVLFVFKVPCNCNVFSQSSAQIFRLNSCELGNWEKNIGNLAWNISGERNCKDGTLMLSLTSCNESQFTCNNGLCINLDQRCDGKVDCKDDSDELNCEVVEIGDSYNNLLAPTPPEGNKSNKIIVNITIIIHTISGFSEIEGTFDSQFNLQMVWYDKRLNYHYLRNEPKSLRTETIDKLWFPAFYFKNTKTKVIITPDFKAQIEIRKMGNGTFAEEHEGENKIVYSGKENPLSFERFYHQSFQCNYNLR